MNDFLENQEQDPIEQPQSSGIDLPPWIPEQFRPSQFENDKEELEFYRQAMPGMARFFESPEFVDNFAGKYQQLLAEREQEIENFKSHFQNFKSNPKGYLKTWLPEYYEELGVESPYSEEQIDSAVEEKMVEEFGADWRDIFNPDDLIKPRSLSAKMQRFSDKAYQDLERENQKRLEKIEKIRLEGGPKAAPQGSISAEDQARALAEQFVVLNEKYGIDEDTYDEIIAYASEKQMTMEDILLMATLPNMIEYVEQDAYERGRQAVLEEMKKAGRVRTVNDDDRPQRQQTAQPTTAKWNLPPY